MDFAKRLIAGLLATLMAYMPGPAWAGYAQLAAPVGFSGSRGAFRYAAAANDLIFGSTILQPGALTANVGGQAVKMPAAYRLAANSGRFLAGAAFANPYWLVASLAVPVVYDYFKSGGFEFIDGAWKKRTLSDAYQYRVLGTDIWSSSVSSACSVFVAGEKIRRGASSAAVTGSSQVDLTCTYVLTYVTWLNGVPTYGSLPPNTTGVSRAITQVYDPTKFPVVGRSEFEDGMSVLPMPGEIPKVVPIPFPVEDPIMNPAPGANPVPRPMRVPTGDPIPVPDSVPQKWRQPYVDIVPSPTPDSPWRVDLRPGERLQDSPTPMPEPLPNPVPDPNDIPTEKQPDLCEKYPEILACQKLELGELSPEIVPDEAKTITMVPDGGWGSGGACPPPRRITLGGGLSFEIPLDVLCDFARMIRPLVVAMAYLGAAMMLVGAARRD